MARFRHFDDEEKKIILTLMWTMTNQEIAYIIGCSPSTVSKYRIDHGFRVQIKWDAEKDEKLLGMVKRKCTTQEIADAFNTNRTTVQSRIETLRQFGIDIPHRNLGRGKGITPEQRKNKSLKECARYHNLSPEQRRQVDLRNAELKRIRRANDEVYRSHVNLENSRRRMERLYRQCLEKYENQ